jgi:hypothetical protein
VASRGIKGPLHAWQSSEYCGRCQKLTATV